MTSAPLPANCGSLWSAHSPCLCSGTGDVSLNRLGCRTRDRPAPSSLAGGSIERMTEDARALWDAEADTFDDAADHGLLDPDVRRAWANLLLPLIDGRALQVADLGCGTGTLSVLLASEGGHFVSGVDFSPAMIRHAREKSDLTIPSRLSPSPTPLTLRSPKDLSTSCSPAMFCGLWPTRPWRSETGSSC